MTGYSGDTPGTFFRDGDRAHQLRRDAREVKRCSAWKGIVTDSQGYPIAQSSVLFVLPVAQRCWWIPPTRLIILAVRELEWYMRGSRPRAPALIFSSSS